MKLKWTRRALRQFADAQAYIAQDNPPAAKAVGTRIAQAARNLLDHPYMGRTGRVPQTREWVVSHTPYLLVYAVDAHAITVLRVLHGKQYWPGPSF